MLTGNTMPLSQINVLRPTSRRMTAKRMSACLGNGEQESGSSRGRIKEPLH
jgi:hypothetical protein